MSHTLPPPAAGKLGTATFRQSPGGQHKAQQIHNRNNTGHSTFRNFLHVAVLISDCGDAPKCGCWRHDLRPLHPRSARFPRHLSLRVALCAARLAVRRGSGQRSLVRAPPAMVVGQHCRAG